VQNEKDYLRNQQYKDSQSYEHRMSLLEFSEPKLDHWQWLAQWHDFSKVKSILEVGCGPAIFWRYVNKSQLNAQQQLVLTDFSAGMLETARKNMAALHLPCEIKFAEANAEALNYPTAGFDAVLAHLMIYHTHSPAQAVAEITRVIKPTGWVVISTMHTYSNKRLYEIAHELDNRIPPQTLTATFSPEIARELLNKHFAEVVQHEVEVSINYPDADFIISHLRVYPNVQKLNLPEGFFIEYRKRVEKIIAEEGKLKTRFGVAFFHCTHKK